MPVIATKFSEAIDLLANTSSGSVKLLEVNADGSIRTQNWREKLANWGSRLVGRFELRKDLKDAAVANALIALAQLAANGSDPREKNILDLHSQRMANYGFIKRYRDAKLRIDQRHPTQLPADAARVRRDSVASIHAQGAHVSTVNPPATETQATIATHQAAATSGVNPTPSVRDTQEFKDRVTALEQEYGSADIRRYQSFVEERMTTPEGPIAKSLNDIQYYAIHSYSAAAYTSMNAALRDPSSPEASDPQVQRLNENAKNGLQKLAQEGLSYTGLTSRGVVNYDYFINLLPNQTYTAAAFTSTSLNMAIAKDMAKADTTGGRDSTIIHTFGTTGIDIATLSSHGYESEILYPPGSEFRVVFTGEHDAEVASYDANSPLTKKKVSYLVVEEASTPSETGVSGVVNALDLAPPSLRVKQKSSQPANQAAPLVTPNGTASRNDEPQINYDDFDNR
jgi:hypothetical protein